MSPERETAFVRSVKERHRNILSRSTALLAALSGEDPNAKRSTALELRAAIQALEAILATNDRPSWAGQYLGALGNYETHFGTSQAGPQLISALVALHPQMAGHAWSFETQDAPALDFERIYREAYSQTRLDDLFSILLQQLDAVIASGQIDSLKVLRTLELFVSTVRLNMRKSVISAVSTIELCSTYFRNAVRHLIADTPVLGPLIKAADDTVIELNQELGTLHRLMSQSIESQLQAYAPTPSLSAPADDPVRRLSTDRPADSAGD